MITSLQNLTAGILFIIFLRCTVHCQTNSRSYDTNDWIPVSQPYQNGNQNFPQLHAVHGKQSKPAESIRQFQDQTQTQNIQQQSNLLLKDSRLNDAQQIRLSPPPLDTPKPIGQGLPFVHQHTPFISPVSYDESNQQAGQASNQDSIISQNIHPPPQSQALPNQDLPNQVLLNQALPNQALPDQAMPNQALPNQALPNQEREEIQLLYVPLETLRQREQRQQVFQQDHAVAQSQVRFVDQQNLTPQAHKQVQLQSIEQDFIQQALQAQKLQQQFQQNPQQNYQPQQDQQPLPQQLYQLHNQQHYRPQQEQQQSHHYRPQQDQQQPQNYRPQQNHQDSQHFKLEYTPPTQPKQIPETTTTTTTTAAPLPLKKRKPHQPPLAVYMGTDGHKEISVADVLSLLKDAQTITVQDYVSDDSPRVFVGPSNLQSPEGYVKFNLPYLSTIDKHKKEGIDALPFFVAPLNYKTPPGYSKIPFPSPHVGSVVINQKKEELIEKTKSSHKNLLSNLSLNEKNSQLLYNEASTVATHNKNRQAYPTVFSSSTISPSSISSEIPYGPLPIKQHEHTYSASRSTQRPVISSTTPRTYSEPQQVISISPSLYSGNQFSRGHRFTTAAPTSTESVSLPSSQAYTVTTNRSPSRTSHIHQRPQVSLSTPDDSYYDTTKNKSPNRYLPEVNQQSVPVTTTKQYLAAQLSPTDQEFINQHRFTDSYNAQKSQETYVQNNPKQNFEGHVTKGNISINNQQDQEYRPSYLSSAVPNQYEIQTVRTRPKIEDNTRVVTESSYFNNNAQSSSQRYLGNQQLQFPVNSPETHSNSEESRETVRKPHVHDQQYFTSSQPPPQPTVYQQLPELQDVNHRFVFNQPTNRYEEPTFVTTEKQKIEEYKTQYTQPQVHRQQHYKLPADLPISPQLPSLVNSLEDQAIRPLLAPLLLPSAEDADQVYYTEYTTQKPVTTTVAPSTTTQVITSTTPEPVVEITTSYKRLRGRQRATRPTNSPSTRPRTSSSSHRGRRPYQETSKQDYSESTTRAAFLRNRYSAQKDKQPIPTTTEQNKEAGNVYQKRFRTRGRPVKLEEEFAAFTNKNSGSTESFIVVQPSTQYVTQQIQEHIHVTPGSLESSTVNERKPYINALQNDHPLTYLINGQHIINHNLPSNEQLDHQIYVSKEEAPVSEEVKTEQIPVVKEIIEPVQEIVKVPQSIDQSQYLVETTKPRTRTRTRVGTRPRIQSHTTTTPSTTTHESKEVEEESKEFYGFFRAPTFKPLKMEYKPSSELRSTGLPVRQSTFSPQYTDEQNTFYVNDARSSTPRVYQIQTEDIPYDENRNQYLNARVSSAPDNSYEDIKPITIRTTPARRRFTTPVQQTIVSELTTSAPEKYYTSRPKQRSEVQTQRTTRIRGRIRRPTTSLPEKSSESSSEENYSGRPQYVQREPSTNYRTRSRGKTHFKGRDGIKATDEDISENYPESFLKSQEQPSKQSFKLTIEPEEIVEEQEGAYSTHSRAKPKDLVKGEESQRYEKTIEGPNHIETEKVSVQKDKNVDEIKVNTSDIINTTSPVTAKLVDNSLENVSLDSSEDKTEEKLEIKLEETKLENKTEENITEMTSETTVTLKDVVDEETTVVPTTTAATTTITTQETTESLEKVTKKKGRRGTWRLVGQRPLDMFQSEESQNIGTVLANDLFDGGKGYTKVNKLKVAQMLSEQPIENIDENLQNDKESQSNMYDLITFTTENAMTTLDDESKTEEVNTNTPEMETTIVTEKQNDEQNNNSTESLKNIEDGSELKKETESVMSFFDQFMSNLEKYSGTTEKEPKLVTDDSDFWKSKIIGTSTTTEISHETEICYKGRCIKSLM